MQIFHIIEETTDQQVIEIHAPSISDAIGRYISVATNDNWESIEKNGNALIWNFPDEYCIMTMATPNLVFARWTHKKGLY